MSIVRASICAFVVCASLYAYVVHACVLCVSVVCAFVCAYAAHACVLCVSIVCVCVCVCVSTRMLCMHVHCL